MRRGTWYSDASSAASALPTSCIHSLWHRLACGVMPPPTDAPSEAPADGSPPGPLLVIGGAEDKLRKRTILKEFVSACGGAGRPDRADPHRVVPRRRGRRGVRRPVPAAGRRRGGARPAREPRGGARPRPGQGGRRGDRRLHDGRQPAQAVRDHLRHPAGGRDRRGPSPGCGRRRHLRGRQHPVLAHGGVRRRRSDPEAADDPGGGRARPGRLGGHRPALRPAQPLRPAAHDRRPVAAAPRASASTRTPAP